MTRSRKRKLARTRARWASMPMAALLAGAAGHAADTADTAEGGLTEITVTAQKRSEDLQKVPISLTVLGGEKLEQMQVTSFDDYAKFLPSVTFNSLGPSQAELIFRGISSGAGRLHAGALPSVGSYLDEIPVTTIGGTLDVHIYDIARVEALAGPQGTLYGASSLAGTLRIITNKPDPTHFSAGYDLKADKFAHGNGGGEVEGFVNLPITDWMAVRLVGFYDYQGGYINNVPSANTYLRYSPTDTPACPYAHTDNNCPVTIDNYNIVRKRFNDVGTGGGRAALKIDLNENWSITPTIIAQSQKANGDFAYAPGKGDLNVDDYRNPYNNDQWVQSALTVEGKVSNWDIVYTGGWLQRKVENLVDYTGYTAGYDQLATPPFYNTNYTRLVDATGTLIDPTQYTYNRDRYTKQSHELRITSPADLRLRGTAGLFYQRQTDDIRAEFRVDHLAEPPESIGGTPAIDGPKDGIIYLSQMDRTDRDYAVFGDVTFDIIPDHLKISGGIRKFWVENTLYGFFGYQSYETTPPPGKGCAIAPVLPVLTNRPCVDADHKVVEDGETHRINLTYQINPDAMVYGTYSTGFRPGGSNRRPTALPFRADTLINLELGAKTAWFDHTLRVNGAVFHERWKDVQTAIQGQGGITSIVNAGDAKVDGLEAELEWLPIEHLLVSVSGTYLLHSETTTNFCKPSRLGAAVANCAAADTDSFAGTQLPDTPKTKLAASARYTFKMADYTNYVQAAATYQSSNTFSLEATPSANVGATPAFATNDFSIGTSKDNWHLEAYIENAFDKRGELTRVTECNDLPQYCNTHYRVYPTKPENFGIKFGQKF
jgi:iron complex outermembrane recepter protein